MPTGWRVSKARTWSAVQVAKPSEPELSFRISAAGFPDAWRASTAQANRVRKALRRSFAASGVSALRSRSARDVLRPEGPHRAVAHQPIAAGLQRLGQALLQPQPADVPGALGEASELGRAVIAFGQGPHRAG